VYAGVDILAVGMLRRWNDQHGRAQHRRTSCECSLFLALGMIGMDVLAVARLWRGRA
jgi:hypothetical protein